MSGAILYRFALAWTLFATLLAGCATSERSSPGASTESVAIISSSRAVVASQNCLLGCPRGAPNSNDVILRSIYTLSSNRDTKLADWVAYRVIASNLGPTRPRNWKPDLKIDPAYTLEKADYRGAHEAIGVDLGHQAPLATFAGNPDWKDANILSNITPQDADLNEGRWARLEDAERDLAQSEGTPVYVVTGPLFEHETPMLPRADEPHRVPSGYWKLISLASGESAAFIFDQETPRAGDFCEQISPSSQVELRSGLDLSPEAPTRSLGSLREKIGC